MPFTFIYAIFHTMLPPLLLLLQIHFTYLQGTKQTLTNSFSLLFYHFPEHSSLLIPKITKQLF